MAILFGERSSGNFGEDLFIEKAIEYLKSSEDMDMANLLNDAIAKYESENYDEALVDFNKLISKNANNDYALYYRGMIYDSKEKHSNSWEEETSWLDIDDTTAKLSALEAIMKWNRRIQWKKNILLK